MSDTVCRQAALVAYPHRGRMRVTQRLSETMSWPYNGKCYVQIDNGKLNLSLQPLIGGEIWYTPFRRRITGSDRGLVLQSRAMIRAVQRICGRRKGNISMAICHQAGPGMWSFDISNPKWLKGESKAKSRPSKASPAEVKQSRQSMPVLTAYIKAIIHREGGDFGERLQDRDVKAYERLSRLLLKNFGEEHSSECLMTMWAPKPKQPLVASTVVENRMDSKLFDKVVVRMDQIGEDLKSFSQIEKNVSTIQALLTQQVEKLEALLTATTASAPY